MSRALNKAWNVLSDPFQRGRYDAQRRRRGDGDADDGVDGDAEVVGAEPPRGAGSASRRAAAPALRAAAAPSRVPAPPPPTIELPDGHRARAAEASRMHRAWRSTSSVMLLILFGVQIVVGDRLVERWYPSEHARARRDHATTPPASDKSQIEEAEGQGRRRATKPPTRPRTTDADDADASCATQADERQGRVRRARRRGRRPVAARSRRPASSCSRSRRARASLYLVVPSALTGQTLGKRMRKIRVVRVRRLAARLGRRARALRLDRRWRDRCC